MPQMVAIQIITAVLAISSITMLSNAPAHEGPKTSDSGIGHRTVSAIIASTNDTSSACWITLTDNTKSRYRLRGVEMDAETVIKAIKAIEQSKDRINVIVMYENLAPEVDDEKLRDRISKDDKMVEKRVMELAKAKKCLVVCRPPLSGISAVVVHEVTDNGTIRQGFDIVAHADLFSALDKLNLAIGRDVSPTEDIPVVASAPTFTELLTWLTFVDNKDRKLLLARDVNGCFFGVCQDSNGDIVLLIYEKDRSRDSSRSYDVFDEKGRSVLDGKSGRVQTLTRRFRLKTAKGEGVLNWFEGVVLPLRKGAYTKVRIQVKFFPEQKEQVVLDDVIELTVASRGDQSTHGNPSPLPSK